MAMDFRERIKTAVLRVVPDAEVILFGSRARGEADAESDWDFLILTGGSLDHLKRDALAREIFTQELDANQVASSIIRDRSAWESGWNRATPFYQEVQRDGVRL